MFREMRRKDKKLDDNAAIELLQNGEYGILSTIGEDGYPYGVPVNYAYKNGEIFFHCANTGHKLDNISFSNKVSFCVVSNADVVPESFTTLYSSVIVFGKISELMGEDKNMTLELLSDRFSPAYIPESKEHIKKFFELTKTYKIVIEHISGKKSK